jgi:dTDP-4-amino-4,6-dideoxygalactose transaminase
MKIPYVNLSRQNYKYRKNLISIFSKILDSGEYVGGKEVINFEKKISQFCKSKYAVALNSGTDALTLAMHVCGVRRGDEVITTPNSFIASTAAIVHLGAKPVFVDVLDDQNIDPNKIEKVITKKTRCIMPVHLTGRMSDMKSIMKIAKKYKIKVVEDSAQSIGSKLYKKNAGTFGDIGCFSAHPLKNLNAMGDGGYLITNNKTYYKKIKDLSNHGMTNRNRVKNFGYVSRMDNLQAAILNFKLSHLKRIILKRRKNFEIYKKNLSRNIFFPFEKSSEFNTYHTFVIQVKNREKLKKYLFKNKVSTSIHYPIPIHLQPAAKKLGYKKGDFPTTENQSKKIITLPIHQDLKKNDIIRICKLVNKFVGN